MTQYYGECYSRERERVWKPPEIIIHHINMFKIVLFYSISTFFLVHSYTCPTKNIPVDM